MLCGIKFLLLFSIFLQKQQNPHSKPTAFKGFLFNSGSVKSFWLILTYLDSISSSLIIVLFNDELKKQQLKKTHVLFRRYLISSILIKGCYEENLLEEVILKC